jgi:hypothetical protein
VAGWIAETEAERAQLTRSLRDDTPRPRIGEAEINPQVTAPAQQLLDAG